MPRKPSSPKKKSAAIRPASLIAFVEKSANPRSGAALRGADLPARGVRHGTPVRGAGACGAVGGGDEAGPRDERRRMSDLDEWYAASLESARIVAARTGVALGSADTGM